MCKEEQERHYYSWWEVTVVDTDWKWSHTTDRTPIIESLTGQAEELYLESVEAATQAQEAIWLTCCQIHSGDPRRGAGWDRGMDWLLKRPQLRCIIVTPEKEYSDMVRKLAWWWDSRNILEGKTVQALWKTTVSPWNIMQTKCIKTAKLNTQSLPLNPTTPLLGTSYRETKTYICAKQCTEFLIGTLFARSVNRK